MQDQRVDNAGFGSFYSVEKTINATKYSQTSVLFKISWSLKMEELFILRPSEAKKYC